MATKRRRKRRRTKAVLREEAEMRAIDERIAVACYYADARGGGDIEDWLAAANWGR